MLNFNRRFKQALSYILFKINHWNVPVINPLKTGTYYSQVGQDIYLSSLLFQIIEKSNSKIIIDVGCNHPVHFSNTLFFEKYMDCKIIAFDPIAEYKELWNKLRPGADFHAIALGEIEGSVILNVPTERNQIDDMFSSVNRNNLHLRSRKVEKRTVPCLELKSLLKSQDIKEILLISLDVEGSELNVLKGIDFDAVKVSCFIIENNEGGYYGSDEIRNYLMSKGYVFITRIIDFDDVFIHKSIMGKTI